MNPKDLMTRDPVEYEPFISGREIRTFSLNEFEALMKRHYPTCRDRSRRALKAVVVDKLCYKIAAAATNESPTFVRNAVVMGMEQLGFSGPAFYRVNPEQTMVMHHIPKQYHAPLKALVAKQVAEWGRQEAEAVLNAWDESGEPGAANPQGVGTQPTGPRLVGKP